jgi:hypothetical protein
MINMGDDAKIADAALFHVAATMPEKPSFGNDLSI